MATADRIVKVKQTAVYAVGLLMCIFYTSLWVADAQGLYVIPADKGPIGNNFMFECKATVATGTAPTLQWTFNGQAIDENVEGKYQLTHTSNEEDMSTMSQLTIFNAQLSDAGDYVCSDSGGILGAFSGKLEVYPHYDVKINGDPVLTVTEDLKLMCAVDDEYTLPIIWTKNDESLPSDERYELAANNSLIILNVEATDAGVYTCTYSSEGMDFTDNITVAVRDYLILTCPGNVRAIAVQGQNTTTVTYPAATPSGGLAPYIVVYSMASGTTFSVNSTTVTAFVTDSAGSYTSCLFTVTISSESQGMVGWVVGATVGSIALVVLCVVVVCYVCYRKSAIGV